MSTTANLEPQYKDHNYDDLLKLSLKHSVKPSDQRLIRRELAVRHITETSVLNARSAMYALKNERYFTQRDHLDIIAKSRSFVATQISKQSLVTHMDDMINTLEERLEEAA